MDTGTDMLRSSARMMSENSTIITTSITVLMHTRTLASSMVAKMALLQMRWTSPCRTTADMAKNSNQSTTLNTHHTRWASITDALMFQQLCRDVLACMFRDSSLFH